MCVLTCEWSWVLSVYEEEMQVQLAKVARELNNVDEDGQVCEGDLPRGSVTLRWNTLFVIRPFSSPFHFVDF